MNFIGRDREIEKFKEYLKSDLRSLISIVGRRGVGKTRLINEFKEISIKKECNVITLRGVKYSTKKQQIKNNLLDLKNQFNKISIEKKAISEWREFFIILEDLIKEISTNKKTVILIDEFAWLNTKNSGFVEQFAYFYDNLIKKNVLIIITASAISWMRKNILKTAGGLHGKVKETFYLKPFDFLETISFLNKSLKFNATNLDVRNCLQYYLYTGGVPRYLEKISPTLSIEENAYKIFKNEGNNDKKEFSELFISTFDSGELHKEVVMLFEKNNTMSIEDIEKKVSFSKTTLNNVIEDLVYSNILFEMKNYGKETKNKIYCISDLFCYYNIKLIKNNVISEQMFENQEILNGFAFEIFAKHNINLIKENIGKNGLKTKSYSWNTKGIKALKDKKGSQIDLILDYGKQNFSLIECKNYSSVFELNSMIFQNIENKFINFKDYLKKVKRKNNIQLELVFVTVYGTKKIDSRFIYKEIILEEVVNKHLKLIS